MSDDTKMLDHLRATARGKRYRDLHFPLPKGFMIDSGNGPEPYKVPVPQLRDEARQQLQRLWPLLSVEDQQTLADLGRANGCEDECATS